nr:hypothetical protein [Tanacetum cinerariifolium]
MVKWNHEERLIHRLSGRGNELDLRNVMIVSLKQQIQELEFPQLQQDAMAEVVKTESNVWDDGSENVNPFGKGNPGFHDDHYDNPLLTKETESEPIIWDIGDEEEEYPFVNKYSCFQEEPIMLVEEESGFVGKGGFDGEEDNIEDVVVVANDLCSLMIQTILSVDFEEDINTKSHELMSFGKKLLSRHIYIADGLHVVSKGRSFRHDQALKGSNSSCGDFRISMSWITCVNINRNTTLSEAQGVSLRITFGVRKWILGTSSMLRMRKIYIFSLNEPSHGFSTCSPSVLVNIEPLRADEEPVLQLAKVTAFSGWSPKPEFFIVHTESVAARMKNRKCKTRGRSSRPPVKRKLASSSLNSRTTRTKTSTSKDDVLFLTVSNDDEGLSEVHELNDATACHLKISAITPSSWKNHLDNHMDVERFRKLLEVIEKLRGEYHLRRHSWRLSKYPSKKEVDDVKRDRMEDVSKVVPYAAIELIHSDDLGSLVGRLVSFAIFYGRCQAFEQVAGIKEPFDLSKVKGYHPLAPVEVLLSKKPPSLQRPARSKTQALVASSPKATPSSVLGTSSVNKSSSPTNNSNQQDTPPITNNPSTLEPSTPTHVNAEENNDHQAEDKFTNHLCTPVQEVVESSSHNIGNSNVHTLHQP